MRILFLNPVAVVGGAERSLLDLLASLRQADPSIELHLTTPAAGPLTAEAERLGVRVSALPMPEAVSRMGDSALRGRGRWRAALALLLGGLPAAWAGWGYVRRLRGLVEALRPDVIHSNGMKFHLLTGLAARRERTPPVVWHLRDFLGRRWLMSRLLGRAAGRVAGAVAISRAVADDARTVLPGLPIAVVHNAIDGDVFAPGPGDGAWLDQLAGLPPASAGVVRVGLVAAFARWKGQDVFLDAASRLAAGSTGRPVRFYIVGGPLYQTRGSQWSLDELRARGAGLSAAGALGFVAFRRNPAPVYRALDVVVHASTQPEPFGRTIVEGMACGRAVVVTRAGGAAELFTHDHDAVGVPPGDAGALAAAVADLVNDPGRRGRLGAAARATAVERFRRERLGPQVLDAYRRFGAAVPTSRPAPEVPAACPL
jgi:glycosyltransferase involved in cell wall biosynthesis